MRTGFLVIVAAAALLMQLLPTQGNAIKWGAIALAVIFLVARLLKTYPPRFLREKRHLAAQAAEDESQYRQYNMELDALHARYNVPRERLAESGITDEFRAELNALHERYQGMLERKFGRGDKSLVAAPAKSYK